MKKLRSIIQISTISLAVVVVIGIVIVITSPNSFTDTAFDIIAFSISAASLAIAILSQISAYHDRKSLFKVVRELNELNSDTEAEQRQNKRMQKKLNELMAMDQRIYRKLSNKKGK